ncbi:MAG: hypothetical protein ACHQ1D_01285 [Nitrososphaerales archaeon]
MDREEFINNKFITVSGRAGSMDEFVAQVKKNLFDNYEVVAVHGLGEFGIDDKERYLAFITGESDLGKNFFAQEQKLLSAQLGARTHNTLEDAYDYSKNEYETFGEDQVEKQEKFNELSERFPPTKAAEIEQFNILEALWANGRISFVRCLLDGDPCLVLIAISPGADELRVRPLAVMMNEDIENRLEFPNTDD